jgi:hypothetical protein
MNPKVKEIGTLAVIAVGCFLFFHYLVSLDTMLAVAIALFYVYLYYRAQKRKEEIIAKEEAAKRQEAEQQNEP